MIDQASPLSYLQEKTFFLHATGLIHDIGLLHIDRYILTKQETLSAEEWRKIQSHPVIGYEILKRIDKFPKNVTRAVLEHHENLDGSGYPRGKTVHDLGSLGQLINLLDNAIVIYNKKFKPVRHSLHDVIPIIQMTMHSYLPNVVSTIFRVLKEVPLSPVANSDCEILDDLIQHVQTQQVYINTIASKIQATNQAINFTHNDKQIYGFPVFFCTPGAFGRITNNEIMLALFKKYFIICYWFMKIKTFYIWCSNCSPNKFHI